MPGRISLDDLELIKSVDPDGMFELIRLFPEQCETALSIGREFEPKSPVPKIEHVLFTGMGGSAIAGNMISALLSPCTKVVFATSREYTLPAWVGPNTLVMCASYSGETEETRACYEEARSRGAYIVCVTSGGTLTKWAGADGNSVIRIPGGQPPRSATGYMFLPMLLALGKLGVTVDWANDLRTAIGELKALREQLSPAVPESRNEAKQLARCAERRIPIIYGETGMPFVVAYRWKCQINENAKQHAFAGEFPEMNHNEIEGWDGAIENGIGIGAARDVYAVYTLRSKSEHERVAARLDIHERELLKNLDPKAVQLEGGNDLIRMMNGFYLGDYFSAYLAVLNGADPMKINYIVRLKELLEKIPWSRPIR